MAAPNGSQFLVTTRDDCTALDDKETVFGHVVDGMDVIMKCVAGVMAGCGWSYIGGPSSFPPPAPRINGTYADDAGRPFTDIRILHTHVLVDPFPDPAGLDALRPAAGSPTHARPPEERVPVRLSAEEAAGVEVRQCGSGPRAAPLLDNIHCRRPA